MASRSTAPPPRCFRSLMERPLHHSARRERKHPSLSACLRQTRGGKTHHQRIGEPPGDPHRSSANRTKLEVSGKGAWIIQLPSSATNPIATVVALDWGHAGSPEIPIVGREGCAQTGCERRETPRQHDQDRKRPHPGFWTDAKDSISWKAKASQAGNYKVTVDGALTGGVSKLQLAATDGDLRSTSNPRVRGATTSHWTRGILKVTGETTEISLKAVSKKKAGFSSTSARSL